MKYDLVVWDDTCSAHPLAPWQFMTIVCHVSPGMFSVWVPLFDHIPWMLFSYGCLECLLSSFNVQTYIILIILLHLLVLDAISRCCHTKSAWRFVHVRMKKRFKPRVVFSVSPSLPREKCMPTYHKSIQWCCKSISAFTPSFPRRFSAML